MFELSHLGHIEPRSYCHSHDMSRHCHVFVYILSLPPLAMYVHTLSVAMAVWFFTIVFHCQNINNIELYMHPCFYFPTGRYLNNSRGPRTGSYCCEFKCIS